MSQYVIKRNVPILDEHEIKDDDGQVITKVDGKKLEEIARRNNERFAETGDLCPIVIGHTKDDAPEHSQPEIVGYACNFKVGNLYRSGRKAVKATFKFFKDKIDKVRQFPRRSVELWLSDWKVDPIALLGATTPERDLGLLQLSKGGRRSYKRVIPLRYQAECNMDPKQIVGAVMAALRETDVWKWAEQQMSASQEGPGPEAGFGEGGQMPGQEQAMPMPPEGDPGDEDDFDDDGIPDDEEDGVPEDDEEEPERYSAGYPSAGNGFTPSGNFPPRRPAPVRRSRVSPVNPDRVRIRRDQAASQLARYQRQLETQSHQLQDLRLRYQRVERERDLIQLEAEGILFDRVEELDLVTPLSDDQYRRHVGLMRKRYSRAPVNQMSFGPHNTRTQDGAAAPQGRSKDDMRRIADYASQHGLSYQDALAQLEGSEPVF